MSNTIRVEKNKDNLTIKISGRFIFDLYKDFSKAYRGTRDQYQKYVIDLKDTEYMDTSALGMLMQMHEYLGASRETVHIINCNDEVKKILLVSSFDQIFTLS